MDKIYCDWAATSIPYEKCIDIFSDVSKKLYFNPSSFFAKEESTLLNSSREKIAKLLNIKTNQVVFTSCATESNSIVMQSILARPGKSRVLVLNASHPSISTWVNSLKSLGYDVKRIKNKQGQIKIEDLTSLIDSNTTHIILTYVNSLNGSIINLKEIVNAIRKVQTRPIFIHLDAVQALAHVPLELDLVDSASFSFHKIGGVKGVGLLYVKDEKFTCFTPSGGQEFNKRGGTENLAGIASCCYALEKCLEEKEIVNKKLYEYKKYLIDNLKNDYTIYSPLESTSNHILTISHPFLPSEVIIRMLYQDNILAASGSACSKNSKNSSESYYLEMGISSKDAKNMIRLSFGYETCFEDIKKVCESLLKRIKI